MKPHRCDQVNLLGSCVPVKGMNSSFNCTSQTFLSKCCFFNIEKTRQPEKDKFIFKEHTAGTGQTTRFSAIFRGANTTLYQVYLEKSRVYRAMSDNREKIKFLQVYVENSRFLPSLAFTTYLLQEAAN